MDKLFGRRSFYMPDPSLSLCELLRQEFRDKSNSTSIRVDVGFMFLRKFSSIMSTCNSLDNSKFGSSDKTIVAAKSELPVFCRESQVEAGKLLIAHPMLSGGLHRTIVLVLSHDERGSYGVVVNRPTEHSLSFAVKNLPTDFQRHFGKQRVHFGGSIRRLQFLHSLPDCGGVRIPHSKRDLFAGASVSSILSRIKHKPQDAKQVRVFVGCCCWEPRQLQREIEQGYWLVASADVDSLLRRLERGTGGSKKRYSGGRLVQPVDEGIYAHSLDSLGGDFRGLAKIPSWMDASLLESCDF
ncbi:YqgE/AlgH family protein [archaeon]|nr:MAG: YqgE/AlgH family protein [archaeon]